MYFDHIHPLISFQIHFPQHPPACSLSFSLSISLSLSPFPTRALPSLPLSLLVNKSHCVQLLQYHYSSVWLIYQRPHHQRNLVFSIFRSYQISIYIQLRVCPTWLKLVQVSVKMNVCVFMCVPVEARGKILVFLKSYPPCF